MKGRKGEKEKDEEKEILQETKKQSFRISRSGVNLATREKGDKFHGNYSVSRRLRIDCPRYSGLSG